jgi:Hypoxia induced protein conserved region
MASLFNLLALVAMAAVVFVLVRGLWNMLKGGSGNTSNKLMQMRVVLQAIAVVLIVLAVYFSRPG